MYFRHLFPIIHRSLLSTRKMSTATSPQSFHLDPAIFNASLYNNILSFWFAQLPQGNKRGTPETTKQWWGAGKRTQEESDAIDEECRQRYSTALESIAPAKLVLPPWKSYAFDQEHAKDIASPFLAEIDNAKQHNDNNKTAADTLLALTILLDQIPRNLYRTPSTLPLVYTHYDRLSLSLRYAAPQNLLTHPSFRGAPAYKQWLSLPLMHAEDFSAQDLGIEYMQECQNEAREDGDEETVKEVERNLGFAKSHRDIVERFGRFPHRNECLGRENVGEEGEWLRTGETFGVKQQGSQK